MRLFPVEDGKFPAISGDCLWQFKMNVNLIVLQPKNPRGLICGFVIIFTAKGSNHSPCLHLMNWIMSNGRISHFPWQTHRTVSAPFTESNSRSALFNIFRAVALAERQGRGGKKKPLLLWRWGTCKWRLRRAVTKDKARSDNACTHRPWAECWCVLTTRRSRNNIEANQRLVPETLYPHFVWQHSVSVTPTGGSKGLHI